jgi:hypothetical protein
VSFALTFVEEAASFDYAPDTFLTQKRREGTSDDESAAPQKARIQLLKSDLRSLGSPAKWFEMLWVN